MQQLDSKFQFLIVGGVAFLIDAAIYLMATEVLGLMPFYARVVAFLFAVAVTCYGNRTFTFSKRTRQPFAKQYGLAVAAALITLIPNMTVFLGLLNLLPTGLISTLFAFACGTLIGILFNYFLSDRFVFVNKMVKE